MKTVRRKGYPIELCLEKQAQTQMSENLQPHALAILGMWVIMSPPVWFGGRQDAHQRVFFHPSYPLISLLKHDPHLHMY